MLHILNQSAHSLDIYPAYGKTKDFQRKGQEHYHLGTAMVLTRIHTQRRIHNRIIRMAATHIINK